MISNCTIGAPFSTDSRLKQLALSPFDSTNLVSQKEAVEKKCLAMPFTLNSQQVETVITDCSMCENSYDALLPDTNLPGINFKCKEGASIHSPRNNPICTDCRLHKELGQLSQISSCDVCLSVGSQNDYCVCEF